MFISIRYIQDCIIRHYLMCQKTRKCVSRFAAYLNVNASDVLQGKAFDVSKENYFKDKHSKVN